MFSPNNPLSDNHGIIQGEETLISSMPNIGGKNAISLATTVGFANTRNSKDFSKQDSSFKQKKVAPAGVSPLDLTQIVYSSNNQMLNNTQGFMNNQQRRLPVKS